MVFWENFHIAAGALRANKMRSILTTLGIIIGVAAVIAVVSIVQGLQFMITSQLQGVGTTFVIIQPKQQFGNVVTARPVRLTWEDGLAIERQVRNVDMITPQVFGQEELKYRDRQHRTYILGVNEDWPEVNNFAVDRGRFFSRLDLDRRNKVVVIGRTVIDELRLGDEPIGKEIYVGSVPVTVIGIMEDKGRSLGFDYNDMTFIPFDTALSVFGRDAGDKVELRLQAATSEAVDQVRDDVKRLLRDRHRIPEGEPDDFQILLQDEILKIYSSILGGVTAVVGAIVSVALVVGGIGIMNIMLVSVTERTREIGIRKSVGARRRDILVQFLIEAIALSMVGGLIGVALGYGVGALAVSLIPGDLPPAHVPLWAVVLAFGFCTLVGVAFGIYPASKAARLDPIEALRYE
jgi:putative ABC transport system permease protein